jgi:histidinol dehydrogenase
MISILTQWQLPAPPLPTTNTPLQQTVGQIIADVAQRGDDAVAHWAAHWGDAPVQVLTSAQALAIAAQTPQADKAALDFAAQAIEDFAQCTMQALLPQVAMAQNGAHMGARFTPVNSVACYVPGGRYALPSTALMTAITAKVAGVGQRIILSPKLHPATCYAGLRAGANLFVQVGGAQALAAVAYGTQTIPRVAMVVGPGNAAVVEAKRQLLGVIGIDMLAGPSEVVTVADAEANPDWVALDLLAQAEHDPDARAFLLTPSMPLAQQVQQALTHWHTKLQLPAFLLTALQHSGLVVLPSLADCMQAANQLAPEHLQLMVNNPHPWVSQLTDYGALFLGYGTSVPFGDYAAGPNHTLPTARSARFSGALSPLTFLRTQTWVQVGSKAQDLATHCHQLARLEGLTAHAASVACRHAHLR